MSSCKNTEIPVFLTTNSELYDKLEHNEYLDKATNKKSEEDWVEAYGHSIKLLQKKLNVIGDRAFYDKGSDFFILDDWYTTHRSLGISFGTSKMLKQKSLNQINSFIRENPQDYMINLTFEIETDSGYDDFDGLYLKIKKDKIYVFCKVEKTAEAVLNKLGIKKYSLLK